MGMELIERIRERAYQLWEAEGCEHGRDMEYWFRAEAQVSAEQATEQADAKAAGAPAAREPAESNGSGAATGANAFDDASGRRAAARKAATVEPTAKGSRARKA